MAKSDNEGSPHVSGEAGEKFHKRPFPPEIYEEPQNVSHNAGQNVSCLSTHHCGSCVEIPATAGKSELETILKQMTFTRSEAQHFMSLLQSRTIEEESATPISRREPSTSDSLKKYKHGDMSGTLEDLPDEILSNIFIRLLAKQLAQMRSVCKSWNALLSDSTFIKSHLHHSILNSDNNQILLIFHGKEKSSADSKFFTAKRTRSPSLELPDFIKLPQSEIYTNDIKIVGAVNGLICSTNKNKSVIQIWNPSLSAVLTLPPYSSCGDKNDRIKINLRFGYHPGTDDYKVVKQTAICGQFVSMVKRWQHVEIYSMRKGSWEVITGSFHSLDITTLTNEDDVCVDGHDGYLHWLGFTTESCTRMILEFDLGSLMFREIPLPDSILDEDRVDVIGVLDEKLCVMSWDTGDANEYEVWVMEEAESWVKRYVFTQFGEDTCPLGFTSNNEFVVEGDGYVVLLDPSTNEQKVLENLGPEVDKVVEYVDSLVWIAPAEQA